jgi:diaminohydroxyphosphoribosylaminopyrimidine deaminase/5-amino-6-(5-phosphoribosylamino)uracil reductase
MEHRSPIPFVMSQGRSLPSSSKLAMRKAEVLRGSVQDSLRELGGRGINRLLVEGGARVARSFLEAGLVDQFYLIRSPAIVGPQGVDALADLPVEQALQPFAMREEERLGDDVLTFYENVLTSPSP